MMTCKFVVGHTYARTFDTAERLFKCLYVSNEYVILEGDKYPDTKNSGRFELAVCIRNGVTYWKEIIPPHEKFFAQFVTGEISVPFDRLKDILETYNNQRISKMFRIVVPRNGDPTKVYQPPYIEVLKDDQWK